MKALFDLLKVLSAPPEGLGADELAHWAYRRWVLRGLMALFVLPLVVCGLWGVPTMQEAYAARWGECATLIPRADVADLLAVEVVRVRAWPRSDGCRAVFETLAPAGYHRTALSVAIDTERTVGWRLGIMVRGTDKAVDTWDWDRPEQVHVVDYVGDTKKVLIGDDDPGFIELEVDDPTGGQLVGLVRAALASR